MLALIVVVLAALVPCAGAAGYVFGKRENEGHLEAARSVGEQVAWTLEWVNRFQPTREALEQMSERLDMHREAINTLARQQGVFIEEMNTVLGVNGQASRERHPEAARTDIFAEQVGERVSTGE